MAAAKSWEASHLGQNAALPFSFTYDGKASAELLPKWRSETAEKKLDSSRLQLTVTYTDPRTGLAVRLVAIDYADYPTVEWKLYLKNTSSADTPIIADLKALDVTFRRGQGEFLLHHNTGDNDTPDSYEPHLDTLGPSIAKHFSSAGGRPTTGGFPYFNLEHGGGGVIVVIGWGGQWSADFVRDAGEGLRISGGQELTHFKLHPGEEVPTPMAVLQFYKGDYPRSQNIWRRWMLAHNFPKDWSKPAIWSNSEAGGTLAPTEATELRALGQFEKAGVKPDFYEMDAGWYPDRGNWVNTGTWEPDPTGFPHGLRPLADKVHSLGMDLMVWFEPERVAKGSWLYENHPEWLLGGKLLDLGNADARAWLTDRVDKIISDSGVNLYRQDFNMEPLPYWRANDAPDRQGITEIKHVMGLRAYWDELKRRHPKLRFDSCASGGRRADLETIRRAVIMSRSDYWADPVANQSFTLAYALWNPFFGTGSTYSSAYEVLSKVSFVMGIGQDAPRDDVNWDVFKQRVAQGRKCQQYILSDFYPLTPYSLANNVWVGWQYNSPEKGEGLVQAFRRAESPDASVRLKLHGLDAAAQYTVTDLHSNESRQLAGRELMDGGLKVDSPNAPAAKTITYQKR
jgi:alpha-galactosidase